MSLSSSERGILARAAWIVARRGMEDDGSHHVVEALRKMADNAPQADDKEVEHYVSTK